MVIKYTESLLDKVLDQNIAVYDGEAKDNLITTRLLSLMTVIANNNKLGGLPITKDDYIIGLIVDTDTWDLDQQGHFLLLSRPIAMEQVDNLTRSYIDKQGCLQVSRSEVEKKNVVIAVFNSGKALLGLY